MAKKQRNRGAERAKAGWPSKRNAKKLHAAALRRMALEGKANSAAGSIVGLDDLPTGSELGLKGGYHIPNGRMKRRQ